MQNIFLYTLIAINIIAFLIFGYDKYLAKTNKLRVSEKKLLLISFFFGSIGGILAMFAFRHKIAKWSFLWKFILVVLIQIVVIYFLLSKNIIDFQIFIK